MYVRNAGDGYMENNELQLWKQRITRAESVQQKMHDIWKNSIDLYNCVFFDKLYGGFDSERVDVNFANWYIDNVIPMVYFRDPFIFVHPKNDKYSSFAETMETVINSEWSRLDMKQQMKRVILSACLTTPGWIKVGYTAKIGQDVAKIEEIKQKGLIKEIKDTLKGIFKKPEESITPEEQGVLNEFIEEESIFANWVPSWNILIPEGYHLLSDMPYLIEVEKLPKLDFLSNPLYKNKELAVTASATTSSDEIGGKQLRRPTYNKLTPASAGSGDDETATVTLYHIWDRRTKKRFTLTKSAFDVHFEGDWCYETHGFPYEPLMFTETLPTNEDSNPYPPNLLQPILPQILEQSMIRSQMVKWRKRASAIILAQKGLATEEDMKQLEDSEALQIMYVNNLAAFNMTQAPPLPNGVFDVDAVIKEDLQMGTNMGQMMFAAQKGTRTATQATIAQSGIQLKSSARVDTVEDATKKIARKLCMLAWEFYDKDKVSEIIGNEVTDQMWIPLPEDKQERIRIINSLQLRIDAGSAAPPKDETVDRKQILDMSSIVMTIAPERINKGEFVKQLLKKFKFTKELDKIVISGDEDEKKIAEEENQLMAQGMMQLAHPNDNHELHIQVHQQMAGQPIVDQHILLHAQLLGAKTGKDLVGGSGGQSGVGNKPQQGDMRPPMKSTNPDQVRQAAPTTASVSQSAQNIGPGSKGGK